MCAVGGAGEEGGGSDSMICELKLNVTARFHLPKPLNTECRATDPDLPGQCAARGSPGWTVMRAYGRTGMLTYGRTVMHTVTYGRTAIHTGISND